MICINSVGAVYDVDHGTGGRGLAWSSSVKVAVHRGEETERTAFSPTGKDVFHVPEKFAKLWGR